MSKVFVGLSVGQLVVVGLSHNGRHGKYWLCKCSCGNQKSILGYSLVSKKPTLSCGCLQRSGRNNMTHGMSNTPTYESFRAMHKRCSNPRDKEFKNYGGRGILVCTKWKTFSGFYEDMGNRPEGTSLDRIDVNGDYTKDNCRWATSVEQANNRRNTPMLIFDGEAKTVNDWSLISGIAKETILARLDRGWTIKRAIFEPLSQNQRKITIEGKTLRLIDWAKERGIQNQLIIYRLQHGWSDYDAVMTPPRKRELLKK